MILKVPASRLILSFTLFSLIVSSASAATGRIETREERARRAPTAEEIARYRINSKILLQRAGINTQSYVALVSSLKGNASEMAALAALLLMAGECRHDKAQGLAQNRSILARQILSVRAKNPDSATEMSFAQLHAVLMGKPSGLEELAEQLRWPARGSAGAQVIEALAQHAAVLQDYASVRKVTQPYRVLLPSLPPPPSLKQQVQAALGPAWAEQEFVLDSATLSAPGGVDLWLQPLRKRGDGAPAAPGGHGGDFGVGSISVHYANVDEYNRHFDEGSTLRLAPASDVLELVPKASFFTENVVQAMVAAITERAKFDERARGDSPADKNAGALPHEGGLLVELRIERVELSPGGQVQVYYEGVAAEQRRVRGSFELHSVADYNEFLRQAFQDAKAPLQLRTEDWIK